VGGDDAGDDGEAEPGATAPPGAGGVGAVEPREQVGSLVGVDAVAVVDTELLLLAVLVHD
jgi:hypothetical protein